MAGLGDNLPTNGAHKRTLPFYGSPPFCSVSRVRGPFYSALQQGERPALKFVVRTYRNWRYARQLDAHISRVKAAQDPAAIEEFYDWLEANPTIKWVMAHDFDDDRPYSRDDLKNVYGNLIAAGARMEDIMRTFANYAAIAYLTQALAGKEGYDIIALTLREYWSGSAKLPVVPVFARGKKSN